MNGKSRPVDRAMAEDRPAKQTVRSLWLKEVQAVARQNPPTDEPWYLTLPGSEGHDIRLLIENGLISLTEVDGIAEKDKGKVVAVESNNQAILSLQKKFTGLRIKEVDFRTLIRAEGVFRWPDGVDEKYCRARVINLDLNTSLRARIDNRTVIFPVLAWINKLCQIHAKQPQIDWTLCLTLHAEVDWPEPVNEHTWRFLCENFDREPLFDENCKDFFGRELYEIATHNNQPDFAALGPTDQQKIIMVMVPKMIAEHVHNEGWRVKTEKNLRYGSGKRAPMVTWIVKFTWDEAGMAQPDAKYRQALREILSGAGVVTDAGKIVLCR